MPPFNRAPGRAECLQFETKKLQRQNLALRSVRGYPSPAWERCWSWEGNGWYTRPSTIHWSIWTLLHSSSVLLEALG